MADLHSSGFEPFRYTVILAVRNGGELVYDALESVLLQTLLPEQILLVDDGSTDDTFRRVGVRFPQVQRLATRGVGQFGALNMGMEQVQSPWVAFLDHDDLWTPDKMRIQSELVEVNPKADVVYGGVVNRWMDEDGRVRDEPMGSARVLGSSVFRTSFIRKVGGFDFAGHHAIIGWWSRILQGSCLAVSHDDHVLIRRIHGGNSTIVEKQETQKDLFANVRAHLQNRS